MHIILRYPTLQRVEAILLSATTDRLRVVVKNDDDTLELHCINDQWFSDQGAPVEIDSLMTDDPNAVVRIWHEVRRYAGAGAC